MSEHLSDLVLDEVVAGGAQPPHLESCSTCHARMEQLRTHAEEIRTRTDFSRVLSEAAARPQKPAAPWLTRWMLIPVLATLATVVVVRGTLAVAPGAGGETVDHPVTPEPLLGMRIKGPPRWSCSG